MCTEQVVCIYLGIYKYLEVLYRYIYVTTKRKETMNFKRSQQGVHGSVWNEKR